MRVTLRRGGVIVNIIIAYSVAQAAELHPSCDAAEWTEEDEIPAREASTATPEEAEQYKECLDIITGKIAIE